MLKNGVIWRVRSGTNTRIWSDPRLPRDWSRKPVTPRGRNLLARVDELIDPTTGEWDRNLIAQTFWPEDTEAILSIPVHMEVDDVLALHYDSKGLFSVQSAYKVQRAHMQQTNRSGDANSVQGGITDENFWKQLWVTKCPGKIKHFLWRMAYNTLAMQATLVRRGVKRRTRIV